MTIRRLLGARGELDPAGYLPLSVDDHLLGFGRLDRSGDPVLLTIVPRAVEVPDGLVVALPPGSWRHVLVDGEPDATAILAVDDALEAFPAIVLARR